MMLAWPLLLAWLLAAGQAAPLTPCENALPPGEGFGGAVTITADCIWRPQLHFISTLSGEQRDYPGALEAPIIYYEPASVSSSQSGPSRLSLNNVVLANFTLGSPGVAGAPVLWPRGMLQPGLPPGSSSARKLSLNDVKIIVSAQSLQEYLRFFQNSSTTVYTDNSTFLHIPFWADDQTSAVSVGLLLGLTAAEARVDVQSFVQSLAGSKPLGARNFVLAVDPTNLAGVLSSSPTARTSVPFLMYVSGNVSISTAVLKAKVVPVNRPLYVIGKSTDRTSIDFGMEVNTLQLGPQGSILFNQLILENLAPGDARSAALAGSYEVLMPYNVWAVAFDRAGSESPRLRLDNTTLVLATMALEQYLFKATLFRVKPAGFAQQLEQIMKRVSQWDVSWVEDSDSVFTDVYRSSAMSFSRVNMTSQPLIAVALPLPSRSSVASASQHALSEYQLTHIGQSGMNTMQLAPFGGADPSVSGARELIMLTTNITFRPDSTSAGAAAAVAPAPAAAGSAAAGSAPDAGLYRQLRKFLAANVAQQAMQQHLVMGIVTPPVTLDLAYTQDLVQLPANMPAGYFGLVNMVMLHLSQGPKAMSPDATVLLPDVWTHLLWSIPRTSKNVVLLSNVTLYVPAAEFSFIRSHTAEQPTSFTINLQGDTNMRFYNVRDLRTDGLFIQHYQGPGLEAESLNLRVEAGWSQNGPPRGFWATSGPTPVEQHDSHPGRLSDATVVVLAVCLVTAVVASVLACLAYVFWRKRAAENRLQAQRAAEAAKDAENGEDGLSGKSSSGGPHHHHPRSTGDRSGGGSGSDLGVMGPRARRPPGLVRGLLQDSTPVHDSSDSYNVAEAVDRAALTAELARSKFGIRDVALAHGGSSSSGGSSGDGGGRGRRGSLTGQLLPPAAAAGSLSASSAAPDACLHRLQSAITVLSQDVLSRRLQLAAGPDGAPAGAAAAAAAAGAAGTAAAGLARRSQPTLATQGQQQQWLTPPPEAADVEEWQQHHQHHQQQLGPVLNRRSTRSSGSLGRPSVPVASPSAAAAAEQQQQRIGSGGADAAADGQRGASRAPSQAAAAAGAAAAVGSLAKTSTGSSSSGRVGSSGGIEQLKLLQLVGQGTFGQVYKALWRRRCVAVKVLQLPATAGSSDVPWKGMGQRPNSHREKMAVMETVVSTTMSHPNIVQVYTYVLQPLMEGSMLSSRRQQDKKQQRQEQQPAPQHLQLEQQEAQRPLAVQEIELQPQPPQQPGLGVQGAAAALLARIKSAPPPQQQQQQQQQAGKLPPDRGPPPVSTQQPEPAAADAAGAAANGGGTQPHEHQHSGSLGSSKGRMASLCNDSSQSLGAVQASCHELSRLSPAMAKAAAAALPGAAGGEGNGKPGAGTSSGGSSDGHEDSPPHQVLVGWCLKLVMEFCDGGSLRTALDHKLLIDRTTGLPALECVLFLAHDVACAMIHLHSEHLLHGDLKASNVLLKRTAPRLPLREESPSTPAGAAAAGAAAQRGRRWGQQQHGHGSQAGSLLGEGLGLMAKVADFGLSLTLGPTDTHVSQMHMGTLTHMAPELLLHGRASKASDVYAFGVLLFELATGRRPYSGTPVGMLAHKVVQQGWRPAWPGGCCLPLKALVEACWTQDAADRPCFEQVVQQLEDMASHLDDLKQQQAQAMAAAAAPLFHPAHGSQQDSDPGHELTPSMMAELMPSGFGPGSGPSDIEEEAQGSGVLYEMSRISGGSNDRGAVLDLHSDGDADAAVVEEGGLGGLALPRPRLLAGLFGAAPCAGEAGAAEGRVEGSHSRSGSKHSRVAVVQLG